MKHDKIHAEASKLLSKRNIDVKDAFFVKHKLATDRAETIGFIREIVRRELEIASENMELDRKLSEINNNLGKIKHVLKGKLRLPVRGCHLEIEAEGNQNQSMNLQTHRDSAPLESKIQTEPREIDLNSNRGNERYVASLGDVVRARNMEYSGNSGVNHSESSNDRNRRLRSFLNKSSNQESLPLVVKIGTAKEINILVSDEKQIKLPTLPARIVGLKKASS